jgi:hypothetical protein
MPSNGFTHESTKNKSKEWFTPRKIFDALGLEFDLDPCSPGKDIVPWVSAKKHYTKKDDGLVQPWEGNVWMNPPYGSDTPKWMKKLAEHGEGIALVFARTGTRWFHDYVPSASAICFPKGRLKFINRDDAEAYANGDIDPKEGAGADSVLIAYGYHNARALYRSGLGITLLVHKQHKSD